jgi:hypothetical protein
LCVIVPVADVFVFNFSEVYVREVKPEINKSTPTFKVPPIPTPPVTTKAPDVVEEDSVEFVTTIAPEVKRLFPIVIPEPTETCVEPEAVFKIVPSKYLVLVEASIFTKAEDEAVPDNAPVNVVAVIVFPRALTPESKYIGVEPIEALLLDPVK